MQRLETHLGASPFPLPSTVHDIASAERGVSSSFGHTVHLCVRVPWRAHENRALDTIPRFSDSVAWGMARESAFTLPT